MSQIHIQRDHKLGFIKARAVAQDWATQARIKFGMECVHEEGEAQDSVRFNHPGAQGTLCVTAHSFELNAKLGFLLSPFQERISHEVQKNLDELLAKY